MQCLFTNSPPCGQRLFTLTPPTIVRLSQTNRSSGTEMFFYVTNLGLNPPFPDPILFPFTIAYQLREAFLLNKKYSKCNGVSHYRSDRINQIGRINRGTWCSAYCYHQAQNQLLSWTFPNQYQGQGYVQARAQNLEGMIGICPYKYLTLGHSISLVIYSMSTAITFRSEAENESWVNLEQR